MLHQRRRLHERVMQLLLGPLLGRINDAVAVGISVRGWLLRRCCAKSKQNDQQKARRHDVEQESA